MINNKSEFITCVVHCTVGAGGKATVIKQKKIKIKMVPFGFEALCVLSGSLEGVCCNAALSVLSAHLCSQLLPTL